MNVAYYLTHLWSKCQLLGLIYICATSILNILWSVGGSVCVLVFACMYETKAKLSGGPTFSISWAHLGESIHTVIKCFESMFWIIFSNCLRAIKLPPTNLTLKMRESESASKEAAGKYSKYFLPMTSALTIQKLFVPRFASAKQQTLLWIWASHIYTLSICTSRYMNVGPTIKMIDTSITLLLNAISGQWRSISLLMLAFVNPRNLNKWNNWREKCHFGKHLKPYR